MLSKKLLASARRGLGLQFVTSASSGAASTTQTFSDLPIGPEFANRRFIVGFTCGAFGDRTISSATIGGVAMTELAGISNFGRTQFYDVGYPTGTTATFVLTLSGTPNAAGFLAVYAYEKATAATLVDSASEAATAASRSYQLDTAAGGAVVMSANQYNGFGGAATLSSTSGFDSTSDATNSTSNTIRVFASDDNTPAAVNAVYSVTFSKAGNSTDKTVVISIR